MTQFLIEYPQLPAPQRPRRPKWATAGRTPPMPSPDSTHAEFIKSNFGTIWPVHLAACSRLLMQLRARLDGDLDLALVLAVIGSRTRPQLWNARLADGGRMTRGQDHDDRQRPINMQSVAEYSGIPRETVRRKVAILQEKGWVARDGRAAGRDPRCGLRSGRGNKRHDRLSRGPDDSFRNGPGQRSGYAAGVTDRTEPCPRWRFSRVVRHAHRGRRLVRTDCAARS